MWSERGENCGRGLAPDGGGSDTDVVTDTPTSGASPLPHLICVVLTGGLIAAGDLFHQFCMPLHIIRPRNGLDHQQVIAGTAEEGGVQRLAAALGGRAVDLAQAKALEGQFLLFCFLKSGRAALWSLMKPATAPSRNCGSLSLMVTPSLRTVSATMTTLFVVWFAYIVPWVSPVPSAALPAGRVSAT